MGVALYFVHLRVGIETDCDASAANHDEDIEERNQKKRHPNDRNIGDG